MKTLITIAAALLIAACEQNTTVEPQIEKTKVYIWTNAKPYPWHQGGHDFYFVKCEVKINGQIEKTIYTTPRPSCGEISNDYIVLELPAGTYTGHIQHWCGYNDYTLTEGVFDVRFTVTNTPECIILDAGEILNWN